MKIHFYLRYTTALGETLSMTVRRDDQPAQHIALQYVNQEFWHATLDIDQKKTKGILQYVYHFHSKTRQTTTEWGDDRLLDLAAFDGRDVQVVDSWNPPGAYENAFLTQPFQKIFYAATPGQAKPLKGDFTHSFRVKAPLLQQHETLCMLGSGNGLHDWSRTQPIEMARRGDWWVAQIDLSGDDFPITYKYAVWDTTTQRLTRFEDGDNRTLYFGPTTKVVVHDGFVRMANTTFRGAGVAIPVFSLRSATSFGVGEFTDLPLLADWAKSVGLKLIQLLPINDTSATDTWMDSYPYASISAFALHPIYLNLSVMAGKKHAAALKPFLKKQPELNALEVVDYEAVMEIKWSAIRKLYPEMKADWAADKAYQQYFAENSHWLLPYAAFCCLKAQNGTADFNQWKDHGVYNEQSIAQFTDPKSKQYDAVAIHLFVQWHLHLQLKAAADYAHGLGLAIKGDIPIGIYRYSADAWVAPDLYNMGKQAGAPPDDFAEKGQNWGFPTYNWARMKADGFAWWRQRFEQMSLYFDAFRIDHILGFFRIWSIPLDAVEGILGQFMPAIPVREEEFWKAGIGFDFARFCRPFITERLLWDLFGDDIELFKPFLTKNSETSRYDLLPDFDSQRKVEAYFDTLSATDQNIQLRDGLYGLLSNVILMPIDAPAGEKADGYAFRFGIEKTKSFQALEPDIQQRLKALYVDYFYRRQDDFWQKEAMEKLPALKRSTNMLICGEDLGMVPHCVPDVMRDLGILSLEIQRMPKAADTAFFHPKDAPYLSVVTPSTHDMSTLRGWWEEDKAQTQRFYNEIMGQHGSAPAFCEPWINRMLLEQHFHSPAMWSIFQLQDLMGMDGDLRRENPNEERINVPANPKHYWQYRMHLPLEAMKTQTAFNGALNTMVVESGRV